MPKHVVYTLSGPDGKIRYLGQSPAGEPPMAMLDRIRRAGIHMAVGDWLDQLEANGQKPECRLILSMGVGGRTAAEVIRLLSTGMLDLLNSPRPRGGTGTPCVAISVDGTVARFPSLSAMERAAGVGRRGFRDRLGRADNLGIIRLTVKQETPNRA